MFIGQCDEFRFHHPGRWFFELFPEVGIVDDTRPRRVVALVLDQVFAPEDLAERLKLVVKLHVPHHASILHAQRMMDLDVRDLVYFLCLEHVIVQQIWHQECGVRLHQGGGDFLPGTAGALAMKQSRKDGVAGHDRGYLVRDDVMNGHGVIRRAHNRHCAAHRLNDVVVGGLVLVGAVSSKA